MTDYLKSNSSGLEKAIISTIVYFDIFNYPLTETEIWKWLYIANDEFGILNNRYKISDVQRELRDSEYIRSRVDFENGFYFLKGREELVEKRRINHLVAQPRWKKLRRIISILKVVPFVKMIAACNTMAIHDIRPTSDIDVFIIIKSGRIWLTRFLITSLVGLMGQWRHKDSIANKICLSFYTTDDNLNFSNLSKKPYDIYLTYWIALVTPLLDRGVYKEFYQANRWIKKYLPNMYKYEPLMYEREVRTEGILNRWGSINEKILSGKLGNILENLFRKFQREKMMKNYYSAHKKGGTDVIISDQMLKFHEVDKRDEFREKFERKLNKIIS